MGIPVLFRGQIAQAAHRPALVEIFNVIGHLLSYVIRFLYEKVHEKLGLEPSVDGFHRPVLRWGSRLRHRPGDIIWLKDFVIALRRVHRAVIRVEDGFKAHVLFFFRLQKHRQAYVISAWVALFAGQAPADDLVVPEVHVEGELPVLPGRPEGRHVAHDHLERAGDVERGEDHVRVGSIVCLKNNQL